jgi:hypothetical protein
MAMVRRHFKLGQGSRRGEAEGGKKQGESHEGCECFHRQNIFTGEHRHRESLAKAIPPLKTR